MSFLLSDVVWGLIYADFQGSEKWTSHRSVDDFVDSVARSHARTHARRHGTKLAKEMAKGPRGRTGKYAYIPSRPATGRVLRQFGCKRQRRFLTPRRRSPVRKRPSFTDRRGVLGCLLLPHKAAAPTYTRHYRRVCDCARARTLARALGTTAAKPESHKPKSSEKGRARERI